MRMKDDEMRADLTSTLFASDLLCCYLIATDESKKVGEPPEFRLSCFRLSKDIMFVNDRWDGIT